MDKIKAIEILKEYLKSKPFNWETIYHVDESPTQNEFFWIFKNIYEPRDSMRGDNIYVDYSFPVITVNKKDGKVRELTRIELDEMNL
jgi:hypothetical protein